MSSRVSRRTAFQSLARFSYYWCRETTALYGHTSSKKALFPMQVSGTRALRGSFLTASVGNVRRIRSSLDTATSPQGKAIAMTNEFSEDCIEVLERLKASKNVLVSGSPGTGKSRLIGEVGKAFEVGLPAAGMAAMPVHNPKARVPIPPAAAPSDPALVKAMPC